MPYQHLLRDVGHTQVEATSPVDGRSDLRVSVPRRRSVSPGVSALSGVPTGWA